MDFSNTWKNLLKLWEDVRLPERGVSIALGGGAVLGAAHIGVLKAFAEADVHIERISGTSIGALIAALYAFGKSPAEIEQFVTELDWLDVTSLTLSRYGILSNDDLGDHLRKRLGDVSIEDAKIPLSMIATDLGSGKPIILDRGNLARAVMASTCLPGIYVPVEIDDRLLVDGGLIENVPVSPLRKANADFIIGVDLSAGREYQRPDDIAELIEEGYRATRELLDKASL